VVRQVEDLARAAVVLEQAQTPGHFLIGFFLAAEVPPEAVLVEPSGLISSARITLL
jgi:hypothetical protein